MMHQLVQFGKAARLIIWLGLIAVLGSTAAPLAWTLHTQPSPPLAAAAAIRAQYPVGQSVIVTLGSLRAAQIALPDYRLLYLGQFDTAWGAEIAARQTRWLILLDRDEIWDAAYDSLTAAGQYVPVADQVFMRDPRAFPQHSLVRMQVLTPLAWLAPAQLTLPPTGEITVGDPVNGKYFGEGWYRAESIAGVAGRWAGPTATVRLALPATTLQLTLEATPYQDAEQALQSVEIVVNGQTVGQFELTGVWQRYTVKIPAHIIGNSAISTILLKHQFSGVPPGSSRALAAAYRTITLVAIADQ